MQVCQEPKDILEDERKFIDPAGEEKELWALCLSGGGIRSATFCLGVMQGLAQKKLLGRFHYLSTVSGGGYIGSWLSAWIKQCGLSRILELLGDRHEAQNTQTPRKLGEDTEPQPADRLRDYSNYLSPVWGLSVDFVTLITIILRNLLLNWLALIPLMMAGLLLPRLYLSSLIAVSENWSGFFCYALAVLLAWLPIALYLDTSRIIPCRSSSLCYVLLYFAPTLALAVILSYLCAPLFDINILQEKFSHLELYATLCVPLALVSFMLTASLLSGMLSWLISESQREWLARAGAWLLLATMGWLVVFAVVIYGPQLVLMLPGVEASPVAIGTGTGFLGFMVSLIGYLSKNGAALKKGAQGFASATGTRLLDLAAAAVVLGLAVGLCLLISFPFSGQGRPAVINVATGTEKPSYPPDLALSEQNISNAATSIKGIADTYISLVDASAPLSADDMKIVSASTLATMRQSANMISTETRQIFGDPPRDISLTNPSQMAMAVSVSNHIRTAAAAIESLARYSQNQEACSQAMNLIARANTALGNYVETAERYDLERSQNGSALKRYINNLQTEEFSHLRNLFIIFLATGILMTILIGVNTFSLHNMYGNRLVRAYLGASNPDRTRLSQWFTGFNNADNLEMHKLAERKAGPADFAGREKYRLFHVINIALNITAPSGERLEWQQRKAEPFTVSPLHTGGPHVGYWCTGSYPGGKHPITLGRAMAISGAAAAPNMGYHTSPIVAFVMALFNLRLGYWMPNPRLFTSKARALLWPFGKDNGPLLGLLYEAFTKTDDASEYVYLSDGGHFDNLGLYEMVRRGCAKIMVVDASCDPDFKYADLKETLRKIRIDLGVPIEFNPDEMPSPELAKKNGCHCVMGIIGYSRAYPEKSDGSICYIKPVLSGDEPLDVRGYAEKNKAFPHQSTADQFFDESQFESYKALGRHSIDKMTFEYEEWPKNPCHPSWPVKGVSNISEQTATASPPSASGEEPDAQNRSGLFSGIADALHTFGRGAIAATAITIGGAAWVGGTALSSPANTTTTNIRNIDNGTYNTADLQGLEQALSELKNEIHSESKVINKKIAALNRTVNSGFKDTNKNLNAISSGVREVNEKASSAVSIASKVKQTIDDHIVPNSIGAQQ